MDLSVLTTGSDGYLQIKSGDNPQITSGLNALVQQVIIELLSDFDARTGRGSGLATDLGQASMSDYEALSAVVSIALANAQAHIMTNQQYANTVDPNEQLASLEFESASMSSGQFKISIRVTNVTNQTTLIAVP